MKFSKLYGLAAAALMCATAQAQISNQDDCSNSGTDVVGPGTYNYDNAAATTGTEGQNEANCYTFGTSGIDNDIWFTYAAATTGLATVDTCDPANLADSKLAAWPGSPACPVDGTSLHCSDDDCGVVGGGSSVTFPVTAGTPYIIQVGNFPGSLGGTGIIAINEAPPGVPNDECTGAPTIGLGSIAFSNVGASTSTPPWSCTPGGSDVWYRFVAPNNAAYTFDTCGSGFDTTLELHTGTCVSLALITCNDDSCGLQSSVTAAANAGDVFYLRVGGYVGVQGSGTLTVSEMPLHPNDDCANPAVIGLGVTPFDTTNATSALPAWPCGNGASDIWFEFTATNTTGYQFETCGSSYDTVVELFSGSCGSLVSLVCNDDFCNLESAVVTAANAGDQFLLRVGGFNGATGPGFLTVSETTPPTALSNQDDCANASVDTVGAGAYGWDNSAATTGTEGQNEPNCYAFGTSGIQADIWAVYQVGVSGSVIIETCNSIGTNDDTKIAAYPGTACPADFTSVACSDDDCGAGFKSSISFNVACGESYIIQLGSFPASGDGTSQVFITEFGPDCGPQPIGQNYCTPAIPNSSGLPGVMSAIGQLPVAANDVTLEAGQLPAGQFGYFLVSRSQGFFMPPGSSGFICLSGDIGRYNAPGQIGQGPTINLQVDLDNLPTNVPGSQQTLPGERLNFQLWYRDIGNTNNFTDGLNITFQ